MSYPNRSLNVSDTTVRITYQDLEAKHYIIVEPLMVLPPSDSDVGNNDDDITRAGLRINATYTTCTTFNDGEFFDRSTIVVEYSPAGSAIWQQTQNFLVFPNRALNTSDTYISINYLGLSVSHNITVIPRGTLPPPNGNQPVIGIALCRRFVALQDASDYALTALLYPANATNQTVTWLSTNPQIASVTQSGVVLGLAAGTTTIVATALGTTISASTEIEVLSRDGWTLTFTDEFDGHELNENHWRHQTGIGRLDRNTGANYGLTGWGNHEQQYYQPENTSIVHNNNDSFMRITARREIVTAPGSVIWGGYGATGSGGVAPLPAGRRYYTSSRIRSAGNFAQRFGRFEAMIRFDAVRGFWPAFWLMPEPPEEYWRTDSHGNPTVAGVTRGVYGGWPHSGEIDIMEGIGSRPTIATAAIHFAYGGRHAYIHRHPTFSIPNSGRVDNWVLYAVEWCPERIVFFVNDVRIMEVTRAQWAHGPAWTGGGFMTQGGRYYWRNEPNLATQHVEGSPSAPFDQPFHMILNLAVGGWFDNHASPGEDFTQGHKDVQFVRVWQRNDLFDWNPHGTIG